MAMCPRGHDSVDDDFCDVCGRPIGQGPQVAGPLFEPCPVCMTQRVGDGPYCEACGHQFGTESSTRDRPDTAIRCPIDGSLIEAPNPEDSAGAWSVVVTADAEYFQRVMALGGPDASVMRFPPYHEPWSVALCGSRMRVGRRHSSETRGGVPEIDMTGPPTDPGISYLHAVLMRQPDGSWAIVDPGSANGTTMNGLPDVIEVNLPLVLNDGDRIHIGAWTTLEIRAPEAPTV